MLEEKEQSFSLRLHKLAPSHLAIWSDRAELHASACPNSESCNDNKQQCITTASYISISHPPDRYVRFIMLRNSSPSHVAPLNGQLPGIID